MKTLETLFFDELADMYDAEQRIARALPKMAKAATCPSLQAALQKHLKETQGHISNLEQVFNPSGKKPKGRSAKPLLDFSRRAMKSPPNSKVRRRSMPR